MDNLQSNPSTELGEKMDLEKELTNKFLSGEMSFADYSSEWYNYDDEEDTEDTNNRLNDDEPRQSTQIDKNLIKRRKITRLSPALLGLMGEANLRFVRGEKDTAERMCHEIIKQVPTAPEPYQTLAQIYENDAERSLQFCLLAAHLGPPDATEWLRLAELSKERNNVKQVMTCYTQAIKAEPHNLDIHLKRLEMLSSLEEIKYPLHVLSISRVKCYHRIVSCLPASEGETIMKYAKMATTLYHNSNEMERALEVMTTAYKKCSALFSIEDINILMELLIIMKQYQTCLEIFVANLGVDIEAEIQTYKNTDEKIEEQTNYIKCSIPNNLPIDLKSKLLICFIYLGAVNLVHTLLEDFLSNDVEKAGDLYMDIEEALSAVGNHELAMQLLVPLVNNTSFNLGAVWLKYADCLNNLGRYDDAIQSYHKVLSQAPQHADARRKLFDLLQKKGCIDSAIKILKQDYKYVVSAQLLYEQCVILKKYNKMLEYLEVGEKLLYKTFPRYRHQEEIKIVLHMRSNKTNMELINDFRKLRGENEYQEDEIHFDESETFKLTPQQEWSLFLELLGIAHKHGMYITMQRLTFGALMSKALVPHRAEIEFLCFQACLLTGDYQNGFRLVREFCQKYPTTCNWNLLNLLINLVEESSHVKFLSRIFQKEPYKAKNLFLGNNFLTSGRYAVALKYFLEYHEQHNEPLSALLIAITILVMAAQKTVNKHHSLMLQGISYMLTYQKLRKFNQETNYNLGRAYHMLSINNVAIEYYERALACEPVANCTQHGVINLTRETAFNLYLLYKDHSPQMARKYMHKYLMESSEIVPANNVLFEDMCIVLEQIYELHRNQKKQNKKKNVREEQANILKTFFNDFKLTAASTVSENKNSSIFPILRLLLPACDRERNPYNLKEKKLGELLVKVLSIKNSSAARNLLEYRSVSSASENDFAGIAYNVLKNRVRNECDDLTIGINEILDKIATAEVGNKGPILLETFEYAINKLSAKQFKWFLRIILKDLKLALGTDRVLGVFHPDAPYYYKNCMNLSKLCEEFDYGNSRPLELGVQLFCPVNPMLSERLEITKVSVQLSSDKKYYVENKFDGERFQIHMNNGRFEYFSRRGHSYSNKYGETYDSGLLTPFLKDCISPSVSSFILDGEMMGWHKRDKCFKVKGESFDVKKITEQSNLRPCFCAYDVLYYNDKVLVGVGAERRGIQLEERVKILDTIFTDVPGVIQHSKRQLVNNSSDILDKLNEAIERQEEGIVVKDTASYYEPNARNAGWYKIKPEYTKETMSDLDLVIIGADQSETKKHGRANTFHVACADVTAPGEAPHRWISVGRVASGFSNEQLQTVCELLERNWTLTKQTPPPAALVFNKNHPDFWIMPEHSIVLEIRATELIRSTDYGTSHTLRFPRLVRIRDDKPVKDVITLEEFNALTQSKSNVIKLATKPVNEEQMNVDGADLKPRKKRAATAIAVHEQFRPDVPSDVEITSRALHDRKVCVISGDEEGDVNDLIKIVVSHGGKPVLNVGPDTWCAVVGQITAVGRATLESRSVDVVPASWLRTLPRSTGPCDLRPLDLLAVKPTTSLNFRRHYDPFGDSYTRLLDESTLKKCFERMDSEPEIYLTRPEMSDIDKVLFGSESPFSFLRPFTLYFLDNSSIFAVMAKFYGANTLQRSVAKAQYTIYRYILYYKPVYSAIYFIIVILLLLDAFARDVGKGQSRLSKLKTRKGGIVTSLPEILKDNKKFYGQLYLHVHIKASWQSG
ncbi:LOW QUALITY PROTEIN: uncharacterized protein ACR2FA_011420 [Aphomia sociella]